MKGTMNEIVAIIMKMKIVFGYKDASLLGMKKVKRENVIKLCLYP